MAIITGFLPIDALLESSWAPQALTPVALTYSFMTVAPDDSYAKNAIGFASMTAQQQTATKAAMAAWSAVANITFTEIASGGDIRIGTNDQGTDSSGYASLPAGGASTTLMINNKDAGNLLLAAGDFGREVLLHELGHTLGLKHPGDYDNDGGSPDDGPFLPKEEDSTDYTVMSYHDGSGHQYSGNYVVTPMLYDILTIQLLYGANMAYHAGSDRYTFRTDTAPQCIWDAGGTDTFDFSQCRGFTMIDLNEGGFSSTSNGYNNISIAYGVTIERAVAGSGGSKIFGNNAGNVIYGGIGDDFIYLGGGNDTVNGGGGADIVIFDGALSNYTLSGNKTTLTVTGEGADVLNNVPTLYFSDLAIKLSNYVALTGGTGAADVFKAGAGGELFSGGAGLDTVVYSGAPKDFTLTRCGDGYSFGVYDNVGPSGNDLVTGIERLRFSDGTGVALDIDGAAGQTYRMYQAAFDRTPDARGIGYWLDKMDKGLSLVAMAQFFLDSAESKATFGAINDVQFVNLMYANVLHRAPDAAGLDFYLKGFAAHDFDRAAVLESFSESVENQAAVIGAINNGIGYTLF